MGPLLDPLKPTGPVMGPLMGPLKSMGPGVIVPPRLGGPSFHKDAEYTQTEPRDKVYELRKFDFFVKTSF